MSVRASLIVLEEPPCASPAEGCCRWCGEPIVLQDPTDYRRARRTIHYGDDYEAGDPRRCRKAMLGARVWSARDAVRWRERRDHGVVACVDCGVVCEGADPMDGTDAVPWEADHEVPLCDGGEHTLANLRSRCTPCHRGKTAREASARAQRRAVRVPSAQLALVPA